jgi:nickel/cobalt transporter (NicO) family protein
MTNTPALLAAAAGVGFGHAILPDHWVPLSVVARTQRHPLRRVARLATLAGVAHVALSLVLGAVIIGVGLQFRSGVEQHENLIVGGLLLATGAVFLVLELLGRGHGHDHTDGHGHGHGHAAHPAAAAPAHEHGHEHEDGHGHGHAEGVEHVHGGVATATRPAPAEPGVKTRAGRLAALVVPFGAAASPDLTILPVFLAAATLGVAASVGTLLVFSAVTLVTIVGLTMLATIGGYQLRGAWIDKGANLITALMLVAIGALVTTGLI